MKREARVVGEWRLELERARGVGQSKGKEMEGGPEPGVVPGEPGRMMADARG